MSRSVCRRSYRSVFLLIAGNFRQLFTLATLCGVALLYGGQQRAVCVPQLSRFGPRPRFPYWHFHWHLPFLSGVRRTALLHFHQQPTILDLGSLIILAGIPVYYGFAFRRRYEQSLSILGTFPRLICP